MKYITKSTLVCCLLLICSAFFNGYGDTLLQVFEPEDGHYHGRFCGTVPPPVITSVSNKLTVTFVSDEDRTGAGFNATYWHEDCKHML